MDSNPPQTPRARDLPASPYHRALLVDDDASTREFVQLVFGERYLDRCEIVAVSSLGEAVHLMLHQPDRQIDVVLLDLGLPATQGIDTFREFRKFVPDCPTIVFTGNEDARLKKTLLQAGAVEVIHKGSMTPLGLYQAICNAVLQGHYTAGGQVEVIRLPETLLRDARDVRDELRGHADSLPPASPDRVRDRAHMVGLEILTELSREVGGLNQAVRAMRKDLDDLTDQHADMRESVVDLKVEGARDHGATFREKIKLWGRAIAVVAALLAGASWREVAQLLLGSAR